MHARILFVVWMLSGFRRWASCLGNGPFSGINHAKNKPASQEPSTYGSYTADRAVDGITSWPYCTHTAGSYNLPSNWTVELEKFIYVTGIIIYNRGVLNDRLQNFLIYGITPLAKDVLYNDSNYNTYTQNVIQLAISQSRAYSSIEIWIPARDRPLDNGQINALNLCEVEVYGVIVSDIAISSFTINDVIGNVTIAEDETLELVCVVDSSPETTVTLQHDGSVLRIQTNNTRLEHSIKRVTCSDKGQYTCIATIPYISKPAIESIMLFVKCKDKPNPPIKFENVENRATDNSLTLQWRTGYNGGIKQTFVLQYRQKGTHIWSTVNLPDDTNTTNDIMDYTFNGLASRTRFEVILYSSNTYGNSEMTQIVEATTTENVCITKESHAAIIGAAVGGMLGGALVVCCIVAAVVFFQRLRNTHVNKSSEPQNSPTDVNASTYIELRQGQDLTSPTSVYSTLDLSEDTGGNTASEDDKYVNIKSGKERTKNN